MNANSESVSSSFPAAPEAPLSPSPLAATVSALRSGELDLHQHIDAICDRIDAVDGAVQSLLPEADRRARLHAEAAALLTRFANPATRPPLFGALVGVKDIFHVDGFVTRAGTAVPPETFAGREATVVTMLREAGALILGKTVTTEFAYFEPGPTRNPHNLAHTPGGSSSGSAAAVAAGLCQLALGTQTIGSVIRPAAFCGIVGYKPTFDRIPTPGMVYFSRTIDHTGLFTQDLAGMHLAASILCRDWQPVSVERPPVLGIPAGPYLAQTEPAAMTHFEQQVVHLVAAGYTVRRIPMFADIQALNSLHRRMVFAEFAREQAGRYAEYADLFRPRTVEIIELGKTVGDAELDNLRGNCARVRADVHANMDQAGIDLWICPPALGPAPAGIHATGDPNLNLPWTHTGQPALTLPAGTAANGLPLGVQIVARSGADEHLFAWAMEMQTFLGQMSRIKHDICP
jgi:Asp-tRNA(Asn)/Glu-tRNA(Gln) amidotransferase A subunit family amidase